MKPWLTRLSGTWRLGVGGAGHNSEGESEVAALVPFLRCFGGAVWISCLFCFHFLATPPCPQSAPLKVSSAAAQPGTMHTSIFSLFPVQECPGWPGVLIGSEGWLYGSRTGSRNSQLYPPPCHWPFKTHLALTRPQRSQQCPSLARTVSGTYSVGTRLTGCW